MVQACFVTQFHTSPANLLSVKTIDALLLIYRKDKYLLL